MTLQRIGLAAIAITLTVLPATAHHSHANYEAVKTITVTGTVTEYDWVNPHSWIYITAVGLDGKQQAWALETGATVALARRGWGKDSFKIGDKITAIVKRAKDGSNGGLLGIVTLANGQKLDDPFGTPPEGAPEKVTQD